MIRNPKCTHCVGKVKFINKIEYYLLSSFVCLFESRVIYLTL